LGPQEFGGVLRIKKKFEALGSELVSFSLTRSTSAQAFFTCFLCNSQVPFGQILYWISKESWWLLADVLPIVVAGLFGLKCLSA
jgi:hypothetical protein